MKKIYIFLAVISLISFSCSSDVDNRVRIKNMAAASVIFNFRGEAINVGSGRTYDISNVPQGKYAYSTTYSVPSEAGSSTSSGEVSGNVTLKAGTKILVLYSSTLYDSVYTIYATVSSSDTLSTSN
jgi:hypothetical protein